jgi:hypothetical protein
MNHKQRIKSAEFVFVIGFVNFAAFFVIALLLGGDAINGQFENGHYYLANHGVLTEVSKGIYFYSYVHAASIFVTHPLALFSAWYLQRYRHKVLATEVRTTKDNN